MLRAIREIKPRYIVGENVSGLLSWSGGLVFEEVQSDLEAEGYEVQPIILPAASVGAPHRRDRIWFVAYSNGANKRNNNRENERKTEKIRREKKGYVPTKLCGIGDASDTNNSRTNEQSGINGNRKKENKGRKEQPQPEFGKNGRNGTTSNTERSCLEGECIKGQGKGKLRGCHCKNDAADTKRSGGRKIYSKMEKGQPNGNSINSIDEQNYWEEFPTQAPICDGDDGLSSKLDGITFPRWRTESIKGAGNAIVPQVSLQIFKALEQLELNEN